MAALTRLFAINAVRPASMAASASSPLSSFFSRRFCSADAEFQSSPTYSKIKELVEKEKLVVFMKGVPEAPQCGFSNNVVQLLSMHGVNDYSAVNVLEDQDVREGIKKFSNWPTIPQVYLNGEFVGGCDIMLSMYRSGELGSTLKEGGLNVVEPEVADK